MTVKILSAYVSMLVLIACIADPETNPFGECGGPRKANATDISFVSEPSKNNKNATESDTVKFEEFNIFLIIGAEFIAEASNTNSFPGSAYALSCAPKLDFQNISSISISLLSSYGSKKSGTNISDLITLNDKVKL